MKKTKVLLADDHEIVRAGFKKLLESHPQIEIIGQANNSHDAFQLYKKIKPDVVVMDLSMPSNSQSLDNGGPQGGVEAIQCIIQYDSSAKVIVMTVWESNPYPKIMVNLGVKGYLTKRCAPDELVQAVLDVYLGKKYFTESVKMLIDDDDPVEISPVDQLTKRELEIFTLLAEGQSATQIANVCFLSYKTVHVHRSNIMRKLSLANNSDIIHLALRHGVVTL